MRLLQPIRNIVEDIEIKKEYAISKKRMRRLERMLDELETSMAASSSFENPDFKLDMKRLSEIEKTSKLYFYQCKVKEYLAGNKNPLANNKEFNEDMDLFGKFLIESTDTSYDELWFDAEKFRDKVNDEYIQLIRNKEFAYKNEIEMMEDEESADTERIAFLIRKFKDGAWYDLELFNKLIKICEKRGMSFINC
jgi:hypothetical protein